MKWLIVVLMLVGCMSPVMRFGEGKTAKEAQHDTLSDLVPTPLATEGRWKGQIMDAKIRVYADDQYRAQNLNWRQTFAGRLQYANAVLGPSFGVRLVPEYREWDRHAPAATLAEDIEQLVELDRGDDVFTVIGLTSSLSLVSATFEQLGYASTPGRHMMLRGYADVEERKAFSQAFPDLPADEREHALEARRQHKTTALLLHELGHNLGAGHEDASDMLMSANYSIRVAGFSTDAYPLVQRSIDQRLGRATPDYVPEARMAAAPAPPKRRATMQIVMLQSGVMIEGKLVDDGSLDMKFSTQAALDAETELLISKEKGVLSSAVIKLIDRAKAQGLKNITFR
jgi:hypothetical protein